MKILLLGKNGQVGWELQRSLAPLGELIALSSQSTEYCGDLLNLDGIAQTIRQINPDIIVNAAAYTAVDKAETDQEHTRKVNALAPALLAEEATRCDALLVHYSTDYVFDGSGDHHWQETDAPHPLSVYGKTKREGEEFILNSGCKHLIFRTSWVYAARGGNFAKTMLRLAQERDQLNVINDQIGAPTGADLLADVTAHCVQQALKTPEAQSLYHLVAGGETTWYDYARFVIESARESGLAIKVAAEAIKPIPTSAYPLPAPRPLNSRLDTHKLKKTFNLELPHWQKGVTRMLTEIGEK
ncbi:dTDP-4-dehydrorhamnose reductase [Solimicrobium silvestre]|uniref:dTDP-4-dehydrorhamnose reductase n=1 Tax=Solimicrobium silvestre TaxID=2099400 RepID=A0A2S9H0P5_9BURK|nr:dTDP-4-dehydrorhamnose reductase [Solimicrobium silvestre]PRC93554.1 rmlD: dTDP-4-dehydrorhamnose reductase [Solimicrobium silvestre]